MASKPKRFRMKYQKGTDHKGGPAAGKGKNYINNRDQGGKKIKTKGKFKNIRARIKARTRAWKKHAKEGKQK